MAFISREQLINELQTAFPSLLEEYGLENIGIFEEEGQKDQYYLGYTVKKDGNAYMIHLPYKKDHDGGLEPASDQWTIESDAPESADTTGFDSMEAALREI
ncbi:hypothetical protein FZC78_18445 [Rossellomorea vietnamensis]|uniref:GK1464-like domain-containing protein n=1 Tax=Rossellomorea vietnamensis TaxID=218284 RepID=A0A5D4NKR2_9BACI|nr:DUF5634 family protein [Rossellomorea vietnamensis]TYS14469.1 hypothetical protein FZC78_18445 [Rossellomorea vietnamensis]